MQFFSRSNQPPPLEYFQSSLAQSWRSTLLKYFQGSLERQSQEFVMRSQLPLQDEVITNALSRLFRGKCAFCERALPLLGWRFRPEAEAWPLAKSPTPHLYYTWLAEAWENLYPICAGCIPANPQFFPVQSSRGHIPSIEEIEYYVEMGNGLWGQPMPKERPYFLDPCSDREYARNLAVLSTGGLIGLTRRGVETIEHFQLNRVQLVAERGETFDRILKAVRSGDVRYNPDQQNLLDFEMNPFGGTTYLLLRQLAKALGASASDLTRPLLPVYYMRLAAQPKKLEKIPAAVDTMDSATSRASKTIALQPKPRAGEAILDSVSVANFKALENVSFAMPQASTTTTLGADDAAPSLPALLIIGENSAGKSSLLEAIALALSDDLTIDQLKVEPKDCLLNPGMMGVADASTIRGPREAEVELRFSDDVRGSLKIGKQFKSQWQGRDNAPPVFAYGAFRQYHKRYRPYSRSKHVKSLFDSRYILSNPEKWLLSLDDDRFNMVLRSLRSIFSIGLDFEVISRDAEHCYVMQRVEKLDGTAVFLKSPLHNASSGFRTILAMACDVMQGLMDDRVHANFDTLRTARAVVLIDEIEAHLHPRWKMQVMRGLREALPNVTFIVTTHDPLCIRGMNDGEVMVLRRIASEESTVATELPTFVERLTTLPPASQLTVEQLLTSDLFQLYSTDSVTMERQLAHAADLLASQSRGDPLTPDQQAALDSFASDIASALPVGSTETHRAVQKAVAEQLQQRKVKEGDQLAKLADDTKAEIVAALEKI